MVKAPAPLKVTGLNPGLADYEKTFKVLSIICDVKPEDILWSFIYAEASKRPHARNREYLLGALLVETLTQISMDLY